MAPMAFENVAGRRLVGGRWIRWDDARAGAAYDGGWWTRDTMGAALERAARETPDRVLLIDGAHQVDCRGLHRDARALANAMVARLEPGSVISFMLPNWHEAATIYFAATLAGMVVHPILPSLREADLAFMLPDIASRMIFIPAEFRDRDFRAMLADVCGKIDNPPEVVVLRGDAPGQTAYDDLLRQVRDGAPPLPEVDPDAVRMILYTSGTTGTPKGVMHSQNSIHALVRQLGEHWLIEPGDVFLVPSPVSHIGGSIYAFEIPILRGTSAVLMERWEPDAAVELIGKYRCTHTAGATPFLEQLLAAAVRADDRLSSLKLFICGGAAVPPTLVQAAASHFERAIVTRVYGSTEVPVITVGTIDPADVAHASLTDGRCGVAEVKLANHLAATGAGEGEIYARGPQMLVGYIHPEDEAGLFDSDGFYRTGDLGRWVDGEFLVISGRAKDIIIRNGENISPKEIEDALAGHPDIAEIAVVGLPDPRTGERACAVVAPAAGAEPRLDTLVSFLKGKGVASFKLPEQLAVWDALPKNATGKILKHEIRAALIAAGER
ncbi:MAG TPA: AMP-binding protein [Caulobacteraceae bacterium]